MNQLKLPDAISEDKWYEDDRELKYYGSALNKFVDKYCSHLMTAINIDLIIQKVEFKRLRLIESKNKNEGMKKGQHILFSLFLPNLFNFLNKTPKPPIINYKFDIFLITGKYPYDDTTRINNLITKEIKLVNKDELIKFFNFELEFEEINNEKKSA